MSLILPDFLIVGTIKSGTSTLSYLLNNHPNICMPKEEVHFFNNNKNYYKGISFYSDIFKKIYRPNCTVGEKTPLYSYIKDVPEKIHKVIPGVKLIWIFRNPVDRCYSNYLHSKMIGNELLSFKKAVEKEKKRILKHKRYGYIKKSMYFEQVERYLKYFSLSNMHFIIFEELISNIELELKKIFRFLNIPLLDNQLLKDTIINPSQIPRFPLTLWLTKKFLGRTGLIWKIIWSMNYYKINPGYKEMDSRIRRYLSDLFQEPNKKLERIIERKIEIWN